MRRNKKNNVLNLCVGEIFYVYLQENLKIIDYGI